MLSDKHRANQDNLKLLDEILTIPDVHQSALGQPANESVALALGEQVSEPTRSEIDHLLNHAFSPGISAVAQLAYGSILSRLSESDPALQTYALREFLSRLDQSSANFHQEWVAKAFSGTLSTEVMQELEARLFSNSTESLYVDLLLKKINSPEMSLRLLERLAEADERDAVTIMVHLEGNTAPSVHERTLAIIQHNNDPNIRARYIRLLGTYNDQKSIQTLFSIISEEDPTSNAGMAAWQALRGTYRFQIRSELVREEAIAALKSNQPAIVNSAVELIKMCNIQNVPPELLEQGCEVRQKFLDSFIPDETILSLRGRKFKSKYLTEYTLEIVGREDNSMFLAVVPSGEGKNWSRNSAMDPGDEPLHLSSRWLEWPEGVKNCGFFHFAFAQPTKMEGAPWWVLKTAKMDPKNQGIGSEVIRLLSEVIPPKTVLCIQQVAEESTREALKNHGLIASTTFGKLFAKNGFSPLVRTTNRHEPLLAFYKGVPSEQDKVDAQKEIGEEADYFEQLLLCADIELALQQMDPSVLAEYEDNTEAAKRAEERWRILENALNKKPLETTSENDALVQLAAELQSNFSELVSNNTREKQFTNFWMEVEPDRLEAIAKREELEKFLDALFALRKNPARLTRITDLLETQKQKDLFRNRIEDPPYL